MKFCIEIELRKIWQIKPLEKTGLHGKVVKMPTITINETAQINRIKPCEVKSNKTLGVGDFENNLEMFQNVKCKFEDFQQLQKVNIWKHEFTKAKNIGKHKLTFNLIS